MRRPLRFLLAGVLILPAALPLDAQERPAARTVAIGASGDFLAHLKVIESAHAYEREGGYAHVLAGLRDVVTESEIAFINLETPLSMRIPPVSADPPTLGAPPAIASALSEVGVDVVSVANNHAYDQGAQGMLETIEALARAHVAAVGASTDASQAAGPHVVARAGVRVAFVAFTERINRGPMARTLPVHVARFDPSLAASVLARARASADLVVLSIHWSHDFVPAPLIAQRRRARELVALGADVILGHGPHVLQEVERLESPRGDAICAYSLGNLVSNQGLRWTPGRRRLPDIHPAVIRPETRDGAWLRVRASVGDRIAIHALEAVPLWTHNSTATRAGVRTPIEIRLMPMAQADPRIVAERRPEIARALGREVTLTD